MISGLGDLGTGSLESIDMVSGAMNALTQGVSELNRKAQKQSAAITKMLTTQLRDLAEEIPQEEIVSVASSLLSTVENTMEVKGKPPH